MSFGPKAERRRRRVLSRVPTTLWMWKTLPLAAFAGLRVIRLDGAACSVRLPGGWRTQNPFRSTYFGAQAMAAEMSAGAPALALVTFGILVVHRKPEKPAPAYPIRKGI